MTRMDAAPGPVTNLRKDSDVRSLLTAGRGQPARPLLFRVCVLKGRKQPSRAGGLDPLGGREGGSALKGRWGIGGKVRVSERRIRR